MVQESTLLAQLVPKLTNRREDTATDALAFIRSKSAACRRALRQLLVDENVDLEPIANFQTQVTYKDGPVQTWLAMTEDGGKQLLVESKFWAALQQGQGTGYVGQLEEIGPGVLLFVAPATRIETLWAEISRQFVAGHGAVRLEAVETAEQLRRAKVGDSDKRLMLVSWALLLQHLAAAVPSDSLVASDIQQLRGLAEREDEEAFQPIHAAELGPSLARRVRWLNRLIDDVIDGHGVSQGWISVGGLRATPQRDGYGRYFKFEKHVYKDSVPGDALFLCVNYALWATSGDTPLWLWIGHAVPVDAGQLRERVPALAEHQDRGAFDVPIHLPTGVEYERVVSDVVDQLRRIEQVINHA